jgi:hypothetical protein
VSEGLQYEDDQAVHAQTDAVDWRESYYVNFFDAESDLHGLFWQGVRPNAGFGEACFVLYDGDQELVRSVNMHVPVAADIGEERTAADKQRFECLEPWRHWRASYQDGDTTATVDWHMLSSVCDWQWGPDAKRFEHAGRVHVEAEVGGRSISFDGFGQRDRAWGRRNYSPMTFTWWWVAQFPDEVAVQAFIAQLDDGSQGMMGYLHQDGETRNIVSMDVTDIEMGPHGGPAVAGKMLVVDELGRRLECTGIELMHGLTFGTAPGGSQLEEHDPSENAKSRMYLSFYKFTRADGVVANGMIDNNVLHRPDGDYPTELHFEGESATVILGHGNEAAAR